MFRLQGLNDQKNTVWIWYCIVVIRWLSQTSPRLGLPTKVGARQGKWVENGTWHGSNVLVRWFGNCGRMQGGTPMILVNFLKVEILSKPLGEALRDHILLKTNVLWIVNFFLLSIWRCNGFTFWFFLHRLVIWNIKINIMKMTHVHLDHHSREQTIYNWEVWNNVGNISLKATK